MNSKLSDCVHALEKEWLQEYKEGARSGMIESQLIYAQVRFTQLLLTGAGSINKDVKLALHYLRLASKRSAEACLKLGKLHMKGVDVPQNFEQAYFYLRVATLFKCKCGSYAEQYHSNAVSNPHICYPTEALVYLRMLPPDPEYERNFREEFNAWRRA